MIEVKNGTVFYWEKGGRNGKWRWREVPQWESFSLMFHKIVRGEGIDIGEGGVEVRLAVKDSKEGRKWIKSWWTFLTVLKHTPRLAGVREGLEKRRLTARVVVGPFESWLVLRNEVKIRGLLLEDLENGDIGGEGGTESGRG